MKSPPMRKSAWMKPAARAAITASEQANPPIVLIAGSLYLAGKALETNGTIVD